AQEPGPARRHAEADERSLSGLCAGRYHSDDARRQARNHRRRSRRGVDALAGRRSEGSRAVTEPTATTTVRVGLGERSYDILIGTGLIAAAGAKIAALLPGIRAAIVTDENVA